MISLTIFILLVLFSLLLTAWAISRAARAVGSSRGRFRDGLWAAFFILGINVVLAVISIAVTGRMKDPPVGLGLILLLIQIAAIFFVLQAWFALGYRHVLAPFAAYVGVVVIEFAVMLLVVRPFLVEAFVIPTRSMSPTIGPGGQFLVNKLLQPHRLDLVAYWAGGDHPAVYCKRLIGLPGEHLRFEHGGVYVNDQPIVLPSVLAGRCHAFPASVPAAQRRYHDGETIVLGSNEFFAIGDNVDLSADSRMEGPAHGSSLVGVVDVIYWPLSRFGILR